MEKAKARTSAVLAGILFMGVMASHSQTSDPSSGTTNSPAPSFELAQPAAPAENPLESSFSDYVLAVSDSIAMSVFGEPDLAMKGRIGSNGKVQLPLIGEVKVAGLTLRQAQDLIVRLYDADYLVRPQVYLNVAEFAQRKFTVLGQVAKPGTYQIPGGESLSLLQAIGIAGGFTRLADRGKIKIDRVTAGGSETLKVDGRKLTDADGKTYTVEPGDVITVSESWF